MEEKERKKAKRGERDKRGEKKSSPATFLNKSLPATPNRGKEKGEGKGGKKEIRPGRRKEKEGEKERAAGVQVEADSFLLFSVDRIARTGGGEARGKPPFYIADDVAVALGRRKKKKT